MARKAVISSDISGDPDAATVGFGLGDSWFEVDLTAAEKKELQAALARYVKVARPAGKRVPRKYAPETTPEERELIRVWARGQGYEVKDWGQISNVILLAYQEATGHKKMERAFTAKVRKQVLNWAEGRGYHVDEKARIPSETIKEYLAAHRRG
ncbi:Lsr2 protein [Promicromonospora sp. AC04]|uniref:Lsr2 dimerization domain-containing protein n=1 Tax=Promicromonospora sp. AC04 TaxID=2135723 RepID=UPI000D44824B|nr:histone-like nucleoid-structuring protein Lsr2 [Promicromonospora sp. AC04]PUB32526.1 Lsr2 protein [Promicromonospora sp. AC04]